MNCEDKSYIIAADIMNLGGSMHSMESPLLSAIRKFRSSSQFTVGMPAATDNKRVTIRG